MGKEYLKRARPQLTTASEALKVAFTETISGRTPEARGNGLKFVRKVINDVITFPADEHIGGCIAIVGFEK